MPRDAQIQVRRSTAATWTSTNPTLAAGEFGFETDTGMVKIGDGTTAWTALQYLSSRMNDWANNQDPAAFDTIPRLSIAGGTSFSNGQLRVCFFTATRTMTVTTLTAYCSTAATDTGGTTYRRMALYTVSGTTITLVARTANTTSLFTTTGANNAPFDTTGGYPSSYTLNAGTRYAAGIYGRNDSGTFGAFAIQGQSNNSVLMAASPRISGVVGISSGDLPTANQTVGDTAFAPFLRLT